MWGLCKQHRLSVKVGRPRGAQPLDSRRPAQRANSLREFGSWPEAACQGCRAGGGSSIQQSDDVKTGYDKSSDGDTADAGDDIQVDDAFSSNVMSLSYDTEADYWRTTAC